MLPKKMNVLFLCTGNSCRSQMAEAFTNHLKGDTIRAWSAGIEPKSIDPRAVQVMAESGIDISGRSSKSPDDLKDVAFDVVITVCDHAHESCPVFPDKTRVVHAGFDDPPRLAAQAASEQEALSHYRRVRDEIRAFVERMEEGEERL